MSKELKSLMRDQLAAELEGVDGGILINAQALNSEKTYAFRKAMHARKLQYTVLRNSTATHAFIGKGYKKADLEKVFKGPCGVLFSKEEGSATICAKNLSDWKKEAKDKAVEWKGAFLDGVVIGNAKDAEALKSAPGKREARAMLAGALQGPIAKFAATLKEMYARFAYAVHALEKKQGGAAKA